MRSFKFHLSTTLQIIVFGVFAMLFMSWIIKEVLQPISSLITITLVLFGTILSFRRQTTTMMTLGGITLYSVSWFIAKQCNVWIAMCFCTTGILLWITGAFMPSVTLSPSRA